MVTKSKAKASKQVAFPQQQTWWKNKFLVFYLLPLAIPAGWMLDNIIKYGVNFVYSDAWLIVPTLQNIDQGNINFHDFWQVQGSHRLFFTNILISTLAFMSSWNTKLEMYVSFGLCLASAFLIYLFVRRSIKSTMLALLAMLTTAWWFFSPVQSENWLWGWDVAWFICTFTSLATIYFITRAVGKRINLFFGLALVAALVSTFSFGWGQAIWPVGIAMLLAQKQKKQPIIIWAVTALLAYGAYYFRFENIGSPPVPLTAFLYEPINALCYYFIMFGRMFSNDLDTAMLLGAIILLTLIPVLLMVWERRDKITLFIPWLGIILFSLLGAVMIILGRLHGNPAIDTPLTDAMQSRYTGMSILYIVGLCGLIYTLIESFGAGKKLLKYIVLITLVIQIPLVFSSYKVGNLTTVERRILMDRLRACALEPTEKVTKDCISSNNYRNTEETARLQLQYLKDKGWGGF